MAGPDDPGGSSVGAGQPDIPGPLITGPVAPPSYPAAALTMLFLVALPAVAPIVPPPTIPPSFVEEAPPASERAFVSMADVLALVASISNNQADMLSAERYYRDVVYDLCKRAFVTNVTTLSVEPLQEELAYSTDIIEIYAVAFDDRMLDRVTDKRVMEWISRTWRDDVGMPVAWIEDDEAINQIRLYPLPELPSTDK